MHGIPHEIIGLAPQRHVVKLGEMEPIDRNHG
jgi:hypothetical protein